MSALKRLAGLAVCGHLGHRREPRCSRCGLVPRPWHYAVVVLMWIF